MKRIQEIFEVQKIAHQETNTIFGGGLAEYKYYDMHQVIAIALARVEKIKNQ